MVHDRTTKSLLTLLVCSMLTFVMTRSALAQATKSTEATKAAENQIATTGRDLAGVLNTEAQAAFDAAQKASKAATAAASAAEGAETSSKNTAATLDDLKKAGRAAATAANAAVKEANGAAEAAAKAAQMITTDAAKAAAGLAVGKAIAAAKAAISASETASKADTALAATTTVDEAKKQVVVAAEATGKAAIAVIEAARAAMEVVVEATRPRLPVTSPRDENVFEALRARITGGAIFFNGAASIVPNSEGTAATVQSNQFSQAATYLAFETQPRLWSADLGFCRGDDVCKASRDVQARTRGYNRVYIDPFANVRLTTIPVAGAANTLTTIETPSPAFLQSQKAVQLQLGAMAGFNFGRFEIRETSFHWGFGPVYRFMFQNVTDSQRALRPWDIDNDLFKLQSGGLRLTLYEKDQRVGDSTRVGWAPAAYIDISRGRFENFETAKGNTDAARTCLRNVSACLVRPDGIPPENEFDKSSPMRWYLEGRIFLQYLYFGFDLNSGSGSDDLRFIAGLSVKLDTFLTRRN